MQIDTPVSTVLGGNKGGEKAQFGERGSGARGQNPSISPRKVFGHPGDYLVFRAGQIAVVKIGWKKVSRVNYIGEINPRGINSNILMVTTLWNFD